MSNNKKASDIVFELLGEDTTVIYNGKRIYDLNPYLILGQGITTSELRNLKALHAEKLKFFDLMKNTEDSKLLKEYANEIEFIEFEMQENWRFSKDRNFHEWYNVPKCSCPKLDNIDYRGSSRKIINLDCKVHGD